MKKLALCLLLPLLLQAKVELYLRDARFAQGVVRTVSGGVIQDSHIRIQAQQLSYQKTDKAESVSAQGNLLVLIDKRILTGRSLDYDFVKGCGIVHQPLLSSDGFVISGQYLLLENDGALVVVNGSVYPSTDINAAVSFERLRLQRGNEVHARRLSIRLFDKTIFAMENFRTTLDALSDLPVQFRFSFSGYEKSRAMVRWRLFRNDVFAAFLRADWILQRGLGGGLDTCYHDGRRVFDTKSFIIHDRSWDDPETRTRFRYQGVWSEKHHKLNLHASYDWLSDVEMASNYSGKDFELPTAQLTHFGADYKEQNWLADFRVLTRINDFQTVNQQLPGFVFSWRPFQLGPTGILCDNRLKLAYYNYAYAKGTPGVSDFDAARLQQTCRAWRPSLFGPVLVTPEVGSNVIYYSNSTAGGSKMQAIAFLGMESSLPLHRSNSWCLHTVEPYMRYRFYSRPTADFRETYIFSIDDGYAPMSALTLGARQSFFWGNACFARPLFADLWAHAFMDNKTLQKNVPRVYGSLQWKPFDNVETRFEGAWNRETNSFDYTNLGVGWTISRNLAASVDVLRRGERAWRKANPDNFFMDLAQPESTLTGSLASDRRKTLLTNVFWRFHPDWTGQFQTHTGWGRPNEPAYNEYKLQATTVIFGNWRLSVSYERREIEDRWAIGLRMIPY